MCTIYNDQGNWHIVTSNIYHLFETFKFLPEVILKYSVSCQLYIPPKLYRTLLCRSELIRFNSVWGGILGTPTLANVNVSKNMTIKSLYEIKYIMNLRCLPTLIATT